MYSIYTILTLFFLE